MYKFWAVTCHSNKNDEDIEDIDVDSNGFKTGLTPSPMPNLMDWDCRKLVYPLIVCLEYIPLKCVRIYRTGTIYPLIVCLKFSIFATFGGYKLYPFILIVC